MKNILKISAVLIMCISLKINAQDNINTVDSLSNQLLSNSTRYTEGVTEYRVIRRNVLETYFKEIEKIDAEKSGAVMNSAVKISDLKTEKESLQDDLSDLNIKYEEAIKANNSINFVGVSIAKGAYNIIMWGIVAVLAGALIIIFAMYKRSHSLTRGAKNELEEVHQEYDAYRKRALKREQEVSSSYQRQINKLKGN